MVSSTQHTEGEDGATDLSIPEALRRCMQQAPLPFAITRGADHRLVYANTAFFRLLGIASRARPGTPIAAVFSVAGGPALSAILNRAFLSGVEVLDEPISAEGPDSRGWQCSIWPVIADDGRTEALGIEFRDQPPRDEGEELQRQVAEQMLLGALRERGLAEDAEAGRRRATFLAEAGRLLTESVDQASTMVALAKLALPPLGAWCIVDVLEEGNPIRRLGIYHPDPEKQNLARELQLSWAPEPEDPFGAPAMLRDARTIAITENIELTLAATAHSAENLHILRQLGIGSLLTVPLVARNRLLGAITFVSAQRGVIYSPEDVQLAEDVAARGALALDNAQVYDLAGVLQRTAETANRAKTAFLGAMSHELRTPLNAIGGYIDLLDMGLRGPVTDQQHADFARVRTNQRHLALLISEILNFARGGSANLTNALTDINACDTLQHAIELVEPLFGQKAIVFDGVAGDRALTARADRERVTQILVNLLSNAIKFTSGGGHIGVECAVAGDRVSMSVRDSGIGIPAEKHEAIFEPFTQLKESLTDREGGVGLGLAISRDLARAMNGDLTVESWEGKGSRFTLWLPPGNDQQEA